MAQETRKSHYKPGQYQTLYGGDARSLYGRNRNAGRNMMIYGRPQRNWLKILIAVVVLIVLILLIRQFACSGHTDQAQDTSQSQTETSTQASTAPAEDNGVKGTYVEGLNATIQISAVGDCTLGEDEDYDDSEKFSTIYKAMGGSTYFFNRTKKFTRTDQLTIANLTGPLTDSTDRNNQTFAFKGPKKYAEILVDGSVEAVNIANDFIYDYGTEGYEDTKDVLQKYDVTSFGYDRVNTYEVEGIKVGLYGIDCIDDESDPAALTKQNIEALKDDGCALIVGYYNWGTEAATEPESDQVSLAHEAIDDGCDLVLGSHPHVLQGVECYNDRYICYSLGNFCFGGNTNPKEYETMIFQQSFTFENGQLVMDDEKVKMADIVPCTVSSSSVVNNYQPTPLTGKPSKEALKMINERCSALQSGGVKFESKLNDYYCAAVK